MPSGVITAFYLFDVAQTIDLRALGARLGERETPAKPGQVPPGLQYIQPPVVVDGGVLGHPHLAGFRVRCKLYDYGVLSLTLSRTFDSSWAELVALGQTLIENESIEQETTDVCRKIVGDLRETMTEVRASFLWEDYLVFGVTDLGGVRPAAETVLNEHGADIAQLLRGERLPLSLQERTEVLRHALSYLTDDLVIPAWNAAFIYDTEPGVHAAAEIIELANSQLLEFRYHDDLLEQELTGLYVQLEQPKWTDRFAGRRHTRAALHVQSLVIDVNELTDRMENAVKFVGDMYAARLFGLVASRLGLDRWKRNVQEKLSTLTDIHRFAVEQTGMSQANILELAIVFILVLELALFFAGIMK